MKSIKEALIDATFEFNGGYITIGAETEAYFNVVEKHILKLLDKEARIASLRAELVELVSSDEDCEV